MLSFSSAWETEAGQPSGFCSLNVEFHMSANFLATDILDDRKPAEITISNLCKQSVS